MMDKLEHSFIDNKNKQNYSHILSFPTLLLSF